MAISRSQAEEVLASYGWYDEEGSFIKPTDVQAEYLAAETAIASGIDPNLGSYGAPVPVHRTSSTDFLAPEFTSGARNLTQGEIGREWGWTTNVVPEGSGSFTGGSWDPTLGSPSTGGLLTTGGSDTLPTALPSTSNLTTLYEQLYDDLRTNAEDMWQRAMAENDDLIAAQQSYLDTLGGPADLSFYDDQLTRALNHLNQTEEQLLAGITEMQTLVEQGIVGAAERQMQMFAELEQVRGERLRLDEERSKQQMMQIEAQRVAAEQAWHGSIAEGGVRRQTEHAQRQADAAARLEGMGIDPSAMATDETAALLEMQAERGDLFSGRIEAAGTAEAGYREQELSNMFMGANRSLEDQLFAGRAATGETEAQALQALSEAVLGQQHLVTGTTAQGRYEARESAEAGKHAERGSAAQRASDAALARLGFAEGDAEREFAADETYYGALSQIDMEELMSEIGLENQRLADVDATTLANALSAAMGVAFGGDEASAMAAAILAEAGLGSFGLDMLNRSQEVSDEQFAFDESMSVAGALLGPMRERYNNRNLTIDQAASILRNDWGTGFENRQGVQLSELLGSGLSGREIIDYYSDNPALSQLPPDWLLEMLAADIATAGG